MTNNPARYGFPSFALMVAVLALAGGCKTQWNRWDDEYLASGYSKEQTLAYEQAITRFRPGQTSDVEVERVLGPFVDESDPPVEPDGSYWRRWRGDWRGWTFIFTKDGALRSFSRMLVGNMGEFTNWDLAHEFDLWYADRLRIDPVPPACALGFKPGATSQEHVLAAWGPCSTAEALADGGFDMRWGSHSNYWTLRFDSEGILVAEPRH